MNEHGKGKFWPTLALCALLLCGWMAVSRGGPEARADNGGAAADGIIAMMGIDPSREHLFLVDTGKKTIVMYEVQKNTDLNFVAGRCFQNDADFLISSDVPGKLLKYNPKGYEEAVAAYVAKMDRKGK